MLTIEPPTPELVNDVAARLAAAWMPGDWFRLTPQVAGHYAFKAAVVAGMVNQRWGMDATLRMVEIGTRAGYALQAFAQGLRHASPWRDLDCLCIDAYCDADSADTRRHFHAVGSRGVGLRGVQLVVADTANVLGIVSGDFAHVDGEHTAHGVYRDLSLVEGASVILADDCDNLDVLAGVNTWLAERPNRQVQFIEDGLRTLGVISLRTFPPCTGARAPFLPTVE